MYTYIFALAILSGACFVKAQDGEVDVAKIQLLDLMGGGDGNAGLGGLGGMGTSGPEVGGEAAITGGVTDQQPDFTLADVERMIDGINNGLVYNVTGGIAMEGDELLTVKTLNDMKTKLQKQATQGGDPGQTSPFTIDDLKTMIKRMDALQSFSAERIPSVAGQPNISNDELLSILQELEKKDSSKPATSPEDTVVDVNPIAGPSGQPDTPSGPSETPSGQPDTPSGPSDTPSGPSDTPPGPSDTPSGPSETPSGPSETPSGQPDTPSGQPDTPSGPSDTPSGQPDTPSGPSDTPSGPSDTPSGQPDTPSGPSDTPSGQPDTPSGPSDTPSGQPDTPPGPSDTPSGPSDTPSGPSETPSGQPDTPPGPSDTPSGPSDTPSGPSETPSGQPDTPSGPTPPEPTVEIYVAQGAEGQAPLTKSFTRQEVVDMLEGTLAGNAYEFTGIESTPSPSTFTQYQLEGLLESFDRLQQIGSIVPMDMFTRDDVIRMIAGTEQGGLYNVQGLDASPGEIVLPFDFLKRTLAELPDRPNIALNTLVTLSSEYNSIWLGENAVDGITATDMTTNSCFKTNDQMNPYVIVNLQGVYGVDSIVIYKPDVPIASLEVSTGVSRYSFTPQQVINNPLSKTTVTLDPVQEAQYIKITAIGNEITSLALCEIEVYGDYIREDLCGMSPCQNGGTCTNHPDKLCSCTKGWEGSNCETSNENIALGKPTVMSSLFENNLRYEGLKAVDGDTNPDMGAGSCFQTKLEVRPWITIDLGAVFEIQRIRIVNRGDCCADEANNVVVEAGLTSEDMSAILSNSGPTGPELVFSNIPPGIQGQFVKVKLDNPTPSSLHLCEIEIYGKYVRADQCGGGNPCQNGGTCTNRMGGNNCVCQEGYSGEYCSLEKQQDNNATANPFGEPTIGREWVKARIDPSVCLEYSCNLPICYVPYRKDCKSYVVCQRTATRSYVAWKMRCAFGSYWGKGKLWTCERVDDLATKGYTCPNDPCVLDKSLKSYPDEDVRNCRTFWECQNGVSKPKCCPPGQMFDRKLVTCIHDPQETCRSPCPLKIEGCSKNDGRNVSFYDSNCRTYWGCNNGHAHPECCPARMSFDSGRGTCVEDPACTKSCPPEYVKQVCHGPNAVKSYKLSDGLCRSYMKCNPTGEYDEPYCCRQKFYYDSTTDQCEPVTNSSDICNFEVCPGYKEECPLREIPNKPRMFWDTRAKKELECAYGSKFNQDICACAGNDRVNEYKACKPEVWSKFDTKSKWQIRNYGDGSVAPYGDLTKNVTAEGLFHGTFDGSSGVQAWKYDHIALPSFNMEITFRPARSGNGEQILASNCKSTENEARASFEVSLLPQTSEVKFVGNSKFNSTSLVMPYDTADWNTLKLMYYGGVVVGEMQTGLGTSQPLIRFSRMTGDILPGIGSLKFGPCINEIGAPKNNGFKGIVTEIKFAKCVDETGRKFIEDYKSNNSMP